MNFSDYFLELKSRVFLLSFTWINLILVSYIFKEVLLYIFTMNVRESGVFYFIFTDVAEVFTVYILLIFFFCNQILALYFCYHLLLFILPSLTKTESSLVLFLFFICGFLFFLAVIIFHVFLFPASWNFFLSFQTFSVLKSFTLNFEAKILEYISFYITFYSIWVLSLQAFVFPILFFKHIKNEISAYKNFRKFLYYSCVIFSTIVTPPDVFSQIVLTLCAIAFCEILVYFFTLTKVLEKSF